MSKRALPGAEEIEALERAALADLIDASRDEVVARWMDRVKAQLGLDLDGAQLRDAIPDYLAHLASALRGMEHLSQGGTAAWLEVAREHALARVRIGFDVEQLIQEFIILRHVLTEVGRARQDDLSGHQTERLADLLDAAISAAVRCYVEARDYAARQKEAERVAFLTHELRNPLSAAKLAAFRLRGKTLPEAATLFALLERNLDRAEGLVNGVLNLAGLQARKVEPQARDLELGALLSPLVEAARLAAQSKGLALTTAYDPHLHVRADPELASSAISNVLDNAVKYTDSGEIRVTAAVAGDRVEVHVWDDGPGLSKLELVTIFEPFERGHSRKPGTGVGLAIARRAIEAQGGSIGAESTGERGSHFWLALPRAG